MQDFQVPLQPPPYSLSMQNNYRKQLKVLSIMQANTGWGSETHNLVLSLATQNQIDIILIQELWIYRDRQYQLIKKYLAYECFSLIDDWDTCPYTFTYIRSKANL